MDRLENLEADSGHVENSPLREAHEEGKIIKRYHDTTVVLVHMNHLLKPVVLHEIRDYGRSKVTEEAPDRGVRGVGMMLEKALKVHPDDSYLKVVVRDAMQAAIGLADTMKALMISEIVTWYIHRSLRPDLTELGVDSTGDDFLYGTAWTTAPKCTANVIANYLFLNI